VLARGPSGSSGGRGSGVTALYIMLREHCTGSSVFLAARNTMGHGTIRATSSGRLPSQCVSF
jgi:hypothetical protein